MSNTNRERMRESVPALIELRRVFIRIGSFTFGGGTSTAAALERELVNRRRWIDQSQFRLAYALSRLTPGTTVLATCTALGWILRGWRGLIIALAAASVPCSIIVVLFTNLYETMTTNRLGLAALA